MTRISELLTDLHKRGIGDRQVARDTGANASTIWRLRVGKTKGTSHDLGTAIEAYWRVNMRKAKGD